MIFPSEELSSADRDLLERASAWQEHPTVRDCSPSGLVEVARVHGLEFATAVLHDRILRCPEHGAFYQRVRQSERRVIAEPPLFGIIPGAFHLEHKNTGADGAQLAAILRSMNCPSERVPAESFGSLAKNAELIAGWLSRNSDRRVALASLSKGAADLKISLGLPNAAQLFRNVEVWLSFSGLPKGTPLVTWLRRRPWRRLGVSLLLRLRGQRYSVVEELRPEPDGPLAVWPPLPPHLRVIHVIGFPLRRHLAHPWASRAYERLAPLGPNDGGGLLLGEAASFPGTLFPVWGADHYLQPAWDAASVLRRVLSEALSPPVASRQTIQSASQPSTPPASKSTA